MYNTYITIQNIHTSTYHMYLHCQIFFPFSPPSPPSLPPPKVKYFIYPLRFPNLSFLSLSFLISFFLLHQSTHTHTQKTICDTLPHRPTGIQHIISSSSTTTTTNKETITLPPRLPSPPPTSHPQPFFAGQQKITSDQ